MIELGNNKVIGKVSRKLTQIKKEDLAALNTISGDEKETTERNSSFKNQKTLGNNNNISLLQQQLSQIAFSSDTNVATGIEPHRRQHLVQHDMQINLEKNQFMEMYLRIHEKNNKLNQELEDLKQQNKNSQRSIDYIKQRNIRLESGTSRSKKQDAQYSNKHYFAMKIDNERLNEIEKKERAIKRKSSAAPIIETPQMYKKASPKFILNNSISPKLKESSSIYTNTQIQHLQQNLEKEKKIIIAQSNKVKQNNKNENNNKTEEQIYSQNYDQKNTEEEGIAQEYQINMDETAILDQLHLFKKGTYPYKKLKQYFLEQNVDKKKKILNKVLNNLVQIKKKQDKQYKTSPPQKKINDENPYLLMHQQQQELPKFQQNFFSTKSKDLKGKKRSETNRSATLNHKEKKNSTDNNNNYEFVGKKEIFAHDEVFKIPKKKIKIIATSSRRHKKKKQEEFFVQGGISSTRNAKELYLPRLTHQSYADQQIQNTVVYI